MKNCGIVVKKKAVNTVVIPYLKGIETVAAGKRSS